MEEFVTVRAPSLRALNSCMEKLSKELNHTNLNDAMYALKKVLESAENDQEIEIIDPDLVFKPELAKRKNTDYIVIHHADSEDCIVQQVHFWHLQKGWSGIGYHFFINKQGEIFQGRPLDTIGAHCKGSNDCSIGICNEGNYALEKVMPEKQLEANKKLITHLKEQYKNTKVIGHCEKYATQCPGKHFPLNELKGV